MDKVELSGILTLSIGIILLAFTFFCAYGFLIGGLSIPGTQNIVQTFGQAFAPLIEAIIRVLYLGIMGWIGSIPTVRGVQLLKKEKAEVAPPPQPSVKEEKKKPVKEAKPEAKETKPEEKPVKVEEPKAEVPEKPQAKVPPEKPKEVEKPEAVEPPPIPVPAPAA
jgi:hypothetical protein